MQSVRITISFSTRKKLTQWIDNGVITFASSKFGANPQKQSKR